MPQVGRKVDKGNNRKRDERIKAPVFILGEWLFPRYAISADVPGTDRPAQLMLESAQYCPVNLRGISEKANSGAAFWMTKGVSDLNQK